MEKEAQVVIGAGFGDEGKGLMTDYFSTDKSLVVRFNGGAQAGHTVVTPDGQRHVFHHIGSGALRGAATLLSRHFLCNPILLRQELEDINILHMPDPWIIVDPRAPITTVWDMCINQLVERYRGAARHGSCGVGINETMARHKKFPLTMGMLQSMSTADVCDVLETIQKAWVPGRLDDLGVPQLFTMDTPEADILISRNTLPHFMETCDWFAKKCSMTADYRVIGGWDHVVFEGAQGLLLDKNIKTFFPHVTNSHTGLHNVRELADDAGIGLLKVVYVHRAYATRHGAGPFPQEDVNMHFHDNTNAPNDYQEAMRFGPLNVGILDSAINNDLRSDGGQKMQVRIALTHLDQVENPDAIIQQVEERSFHVKYMSYGPTRDDIKEAL